MEEESQSTVIQHGSIVGVYVSNILCKVGRILSGRELGKCGFMNSSKLPPDTLPLLRRSNKTKTRQQEDNNSATKSLGAIETGNTTDGFIVVSTSANANAKDTARADDVPSRSKSWIGLQKGRLILMILAVVYGSLNVSMRLVFARPDPPTASASSTIQGWFAVVCFLPLLGRYQSGSGRGGNNTTNNNNRGWRGIFVDLTQGRLPIKSHPSINNNINDRPSFWRFALELAFFNFGTQALINISLVATQGARASFLVQMSVVFTPVVSVLVGTQKVGKRVWIACFVALAGLFVLSYSEESQENDSNSGSSSLVFEWGDWCCLLAALCWSLYIYRLSAWGDCFEETVTQFVKNIVLAGLYTLWMLVSVVSRQYSNSNVIESGSEIEIEKEVLPLWKGWSHDPKAWCILFYTALGPCTLADVFQQKAQASVTAAETNVILSLEPVFTTLLGFLLLGETPSSQELCGGGLILIASVVASCD